MDADDYRKERILQDEEDREAYLKTIAGTGWQDEYIGMQARLPSPSRPPVRILYYGALEEKVLVRDGEHERWVSARLLTPIKEIDHDYTDEAVCPWCGFEESDSWEYYDGQKTYCCECGEHFQVFAHIDVQYSTVKIKEEA